MNSPNPLLLVITQDLFFVPWLEDSARRLGFEMLLVDDPGRLDAAGPQTDRPIPLTEPLHGPDAAFVRRLVKLQPALMLVDTSSQYLPWQRWIQVLKTSSATRRIPVIAFGPHVETDRLQAARQAGADRVVSRGRLKTSLADLLQKYARIIDQPALAEACDQALSELGRQGLELMNQGEFYQAHEVLEHAWMAESDAGGTLYRALLQVAVAFLHVERGNYNGALKMLLRVRQWLDPLPRVCRGVDVEHLQLTVQTLNEALEACGPEGLSELDRGLLRSVPYASQPTS